MLERFRSPNKIRSKHTVANPACGLLNREKRTERKCGSAPPPHPSPNAAAAVDYCPTSTSIDKT